MRTYYKTDCHQEAQEWSSNPAALTELEFANLLKQIQEETVQEETVQEETVQEETVQEETVQKETVQQEAVQQEAEQVSSKPPTSATNKAASRMRTLEDTDLLKTVDGAELTKLLEQFEQEMGGVAPEPFESSMCPSLERTKVSDYQPSTNQSTAGPYHVLSIARRKIHLEENKPYIKKPLNAFMFFRAEQRRRVALELGIKDSSTVSRELGRRWKMLSEEERAPYFEQALREKRAHQAKYPDWSAKGNYGKKVRQKKTAPHYHHIGFPANQQPRVYATGPTSFHPLAPDHQGPYYATWGPRQHPYYQPGGPYQCPNYHAEGPGQGPHYQPGDPYQGPNYWPVGPSQDPFYQAGGPSQGPHYQPGGPSQGPHYQPGGPYQGPNYWPGEPSKDPFLPRLGPKPGSL